MKVMCPTRRARAYDTCCAASCVTTLTNIVLFGAVIDVLNNTETNAVRSASLVTTSLTIEASEHLAMEKCRRHQADSLNLQMLMMP